MKRFYLFLLLLLPVLMIHGENRFGRTLATRYGSQPKGLILEGESKGLVGLQSIFYDIKTNRFLFNKTDYYPNPVSRKEMAQIMRALKTDDRMGVSLAPSGKTIVYGDLPARSALTQELANADRLIAAFIFGWERDLRGRRFPGGYHPQINPNRKIVATSVTVFKDYAFAKRGDTFFRESLQMANLVLPASPRGTASDGGYLAGQESEAKLEISDQQNLAFLRKHAGEFLKIPELKRAADIGEAAAFARFLRDEGKMDLEALARHILRAK